MLSMLSVPCRWTLSTWLVLGRWIWKPPTQRPSWIQRGLSTLRTNAVVCFKACEPSELRAIVDMLVAAPIPI